ncbi:GAF domain-containing protein [Pikeienuella piscinae]|uniref:GAF domain-containing protein n=1 Tax=Pikeienuella piscinae TaxID=2748098 RepID=A0A7M3T5Z4_9RHOB|nr:histidine kinase dimerization/phosphoacceptor domain -containing protein [Pikeienuella piscinae]QIE57425.1 GAF domain-containing protein [Pikeienuella piscinae]
MEADLHPRQAERLAALRSYEILDTDREKDFDDIALLAASICDSPIAVVNLIDAERQWFKAETGLGVRETPLATSICSHVILENDFVEIEDTLEDPRMVDNPLCCGDPGLRFYAGAILKTKEGLPLGTLCVLDHQPRTLTPLQRDAIRVLANQVMAQLEMRRALRVAGMLRREVDHRVKNSLQSLSSFIRIQGRTLQSDDARAAVAGIGTRIEAVAALHEQLYRTDAGPMVDLASYIRNVRDYLVGIAPETVTIDVEAEPVVVSSRQAVAVGTLVNEFVANSFKHAFPDQRPGRVLIAVDADRDGTVRIVSSDNGVGLPADADSGSGGLGMKIAELVCMELRCDLDVESSPDGVSIRLEFPADRGSGAVEKSVLKPVSA